MDEHKYHKYVERPEGKLDLSDPTLNMTVDGPSDEQTAQAMRELLKRVGGLDADNFEAFAVVGYGKGEKDSLVAFAGPPQKVMATIALLMDRFEAHVAQVEAALARKNAN